MVLNLLAVMEMRQIKRRVSFIGERVAIKDEEVVVNSLATSEAE